VLRGFFIFPKISSHYFIPKKKTTTDQSQVETNTLPVSQPKDSVQIATAKKKSGLSEVVTYQSKDSIIFTGEGIAVLFGEGKVMYEEKELNAEFIRMNMDSSLVYATGRIDTLGNKIGYPVFVDKGDEYGSETLLYNFDTGKGFSTNGVTEQGEGYIIAGQTKKMPDGSFFMTNGKYTTCDLHEHPHFYLNLTKGKVRPKKNVVAGPAYLVMEDVPLPLALPFGFFPFTSKYSSGVIMPTYGDEMARGFYLRDGGYYFAVSDYIDLSLTGDIYTKGSWGLKATSSYIKKYRFSGSFNSHYITTITGDKIAGDYQTQKDFSLSWSHNQDAKVNPSVTFRASVDFSTTGYNRNDLTNMYNVNSRTQNTKRSTINYGRRFLDNKLSLQSSMQIAQVSADSTIEMSFPNLTISLSTIYPFKRKNAFGQERWYEKISFSYQGSLVNRIRTKEDKFLQSRLNRDWINGMTHSIPVQASFTLFNNINITPSFQYKENWNTIRIDQRWDDDRKKVVNDTLHGFYRLYDYSFSISANTQLYGFYTPLPFLGDKVKTIRHVFKPSIGFSMRPDFGSDKYGYYQRLVYFNEGELVEREYSPFSGAVYGPPGKGRSGSINFGVDNNIEMKIKSDRDSTGVRKISLIDKLAFSTSYNLVADSLNWSNISASLAIKITKSYNLNVSASFDPYTYVARKNANGTWGAPRKVNLTQWEKNHVPGRLTNMSFSIPSIAWSNTNNPFLKKKDDKNKQSNASNALTGENEETAMDIPQKNDNESKDKTLDSDGYQKWTVPWSFNLNYNIGLVRGEFDYDNMEYKLKWNQSLSFGGSLQLSKNWSFSFNSTYDFERKELGYSSCSISRNLHCWSMQASIIPFGPYPSYNFSISVNSSLLRDLKWDQRSSPYDSMTWY
jgi:hypothetical protein